MRLPTFGKPVSSIAPRILRNIWHCTSCLEEAQQLLDSLKIKTSLRDETFCGHTAPLKFKGDLRPEQHLAANAMAAHDMGVLARPPPLERPSWRLVDRAPRRYTLILVHRSNS